MRREGYENIFDRLFSIPTHVIFILVLLFPLAAGCIIDGDGDNGRDDLTAAEYVPLIPGTSYQYTFNTYIPAMDKTTELSVMGVVGEPVEKNGELYHSIGGQNGFCSWYGFFMPMTYVRIADNRMYVVRTYHDADGEKEEEVPFLNFTMPSWDIYSYEGEGYYLTEQTSISGKQLGRETVTVPAGTFDNCPVFEITMRRSCKDIQVTYTEHELRTATFWFAADVGCVKSYVVFDFANDDEPYHTEFTITSELISCDMQ